MKTIKSTGPLLYKIETDPMQGVPKGKVRVWCVRYETYEMDSAAFDDTTFTLHDANEPEPRLIARLVAS